MMVCFLTHDVNCLSVSLKNHLESNFCILFQPDWPKKLFLAQGVVCGMRYLHSMLPHPIIHGYLTIQNVLVGDGLVAKVCLIVYILVHLV